jgi:hypothetical protein
VVVLTYVRYEPRQGFVDIGLLTNLANKVCILLLVLFERYSIPPNVLSAVVGFPDTFELRHNVVILLLGEVLIKGQCVVLLLGFAALSLATWLISFGGASRRGRCRFGVGSGSSCLPPGIVIGRSSVCAPVVARSLGTTPSIVVRGGPVCGTFSNGVVGGSLFCFTFGVSIVTTPRLVDLLIRIAVNGLNTSTVSVGVFQDNIRLASRAVPVKLATATAPTGSATTSASAATSTVVIV